MAEAARALSVSEATIRRDLDQLAKQQLVTRTRGGATAGHVSYDLPLRYKTARHGPEKQRIGRAAAALLIPGASVALNGGTTTSEVARALATRPDLQARRRRHAGRHGGDQRDEHRQRARRPPAHQDRGDRRGDPRPVLRADRPARLARPGRTDPRLAILGVDALDPRTGATAHHEGEASINHLMATRAEQVMIVTDSSKLGQRAFARVCATDEIDVIVTDRDARPDLLAAFTERGIRVITA